MDQTWLQQRPHLAPLMRSLDAVLQLADDQYKQGRANGNAVDYAFEERVAHAYGTRRTGCALGSA